MLMPKVSQHRVLTIGDKNGINNIAGKPLFSFNFFSYQSFGDKVRNEVLFARFYKCFSWSIGLD